MTKKKDAQPVHPFVILKVNGSETNELNPNRSLDHNMYHSYNYGVVS